MKKIIHLSDLHFGTERPHLVEKLTACIKDIHPDLIIISGDLTQRAKTSQFNQATIFIKHLLTHTISNKIICVPGNHDIALYNVIERFFYPFYKYNKLIDSMLCSTYVENNMAIFGMNSVTPYKPMSGFVTDEELHKAEQFFQSMPDEAIIKIVVMHHNLIRSERHTIINDAEKIINLFSACHVNFILAGHIHQPLIEQLKRSYFSHNMYVITAGTPISFRTSLPNSFNLIEIENNQFILSVYEFNNEKFILSSQNQFLI